MFLEMVSDQFLVFKTEMTIDVLARQLVFKNGTVNFCEQHISDE